MPGGLPFMGLRATAQQKSGGRSTSNGGSFADPDRRLELLYWDGLDGDGDGT